MRIFFQIRRPSSDVDSLTHAFVATLLLPASIPLGSLFFITLGAIIPDIDILFKPFSDKYPSLYIFSHGGFTHSIAGVVVVAFLAWLGIALADKAGACAFCSGGSPVLMMGIFVGGCTHLLLDTLAFPGIPLLYPLSTKKCTLGVFPGPSLILFSASILFAGILLGGQRSGMLVFLYGSFFIAFVVLSAGIRYFARIHTKGILIPTLHPLRWLVIREEQSSYVIEGYDPFRGISRKGEYPKFRGLDSSNLASIKDRPEVKRHQYYSYIVTAERTENGIILKDPLRQEGIVFYPPSFTEITVPIGS